MLRFAVNFSVSKANAGESSLAVWEEIINSFFASLRTFSLEEGYADYVLNIKSAINALVPAGHWSFSACSVLMVSYASLLNILAPIVGGAIIIEILASVFPKIKLRLSYINFRRKKYFFSKLNAESLALAKSIRSVNRRERPVLIFTDAYIDDKNEKEYELLLEAKQYGAICVRDDLAHIVKPRFGKREFYLMDDNDFESLQALMGLIEEQNVRHIKNSYIYLFVEGDAYVQIEKQVTLKLKKMEQSIRDEERPVIVPVNGYRNLVHNLFSDVPLYEPLVHKEDSESLSVTIFGNGVIGTEAFLSAYWLGQIMISRGDNNEATMAECDYIINVVSMDTEDDFWSKIDYINPEIRKTVDILGEKRSDASEKLLAYDEEGNKNKAYCKVRYVQSDLKIGGFWNNIDDNTQSLLNADYFVVSLGSDSDNISIAEKLRRYIGKRNIENKTAKDNKKAVIAYAVFDSELSEVLNEQKCFGASSDGCDVYMHAFGSLEQVYSCDNVYMSKNLLWANETGNAYMNGSYEYSHRMDNRVRIGERIEDFENSNYNYWANLARVLHVKYKVFSLGWIKTSVFMYSSEEECEKHRANVKAQCNLFRSLAVAYEHQFVSEDECRKRDDLELKKHCLAWLEHRRWCAFTRTMGYQHIDIEKILEHNGSHKDMQLKLHACLSEARLPRIERNESYILAESCKDRKNMDCLDMATYAKQKNNKKADNFKKCDYYRFELDNFKPEDDLIKELDILNVSKAKKYCDHNQFKDAICCNNEKGEVYLVSVESVKWALAKKYSVIQMDKDIKGSFLFYGTRFAKKSDVFKALLKDIFSK